ncbi:enoyl-CoA hydratase/isomerase family protein [Saccharopolyspora elongata]|uniref:Enoyl-CoA hydratase/isomerase family protein n=1 Tax=Saccharopolyspora elongata TaxID=2530387 RepID=A0A4R4Z435_9PSEU|nr:enoyl-CoA hydratase/isomerase family protein [Saccharopolyspora elongata]TDD52805.1 enoyl-CoA hydratase/isomerase family protein [Saccharopolyspora elongata]
MRPESGSPVRVEQHDTWTELVLQRPHRRNALDIGTAETMLELVSGAPAATERRVLLLRGEGPSFCAGLDLKAMHAGDPHEWISSFFRHWLPLHAALARLDIPVVCAVQGAAINAGAALAFAADFLIVEEEAHVQLGEVRQGLAAPIGIGWLTLRHSAALARRVALRGAPIPGPELVRLGLAHDWAPSGRALERARALAAELSALPAQGVRRTITGLHAAVRGEDALDHFTRIADAAAIRQPAGTATSRIEPVPPQRKARTP